MTAHVRQKPKSMTSRIKIQSWLLLMTYFVDVQTAAREDVGRVYCLAMEGGNSSDSGSVGIIDLTNMSSSFNALSFHASGKSTENGRLRQLYWTWLIFSVLPSLLLLYATLFLPAHTHVHIQDACTSDEKKRNTGTPSKPTCPFSDEKVWFTDTSTGELHVHHKVCTLWLPLMGPTYVHTCICNELAICTCMSIYMCCM